jgi:hypothetical protein
MLRQNMVMTQLPKISVVTLNLNQGMYLEQCMLSVLNQRYPNLEYIVVDGGSTDGSVDIVRNYERQLAYWVSEPDKSRTHALNKGMARTTGDIMAWLGSDDMYLPGAFSVVAEIFSRYAQVEWLTSRLRAVWNEQGQVISVIPLTTYDRKHFLGGANLPLPPDGTHLTQGCIQQESTFWRRSLWERAGGYLDESFPVAMDFELWARFHSHAELYGVEALLGGFRFRAGQGSHVQSDLYLKKCVEALRKHGGEPYSSMQRYLHCQLLPRAAPLLRKLRLMNGFSHRVKFFQHSGRGGAWVLSEQSLL